MKVPENARCIGSFFTAAFGALGILMLSSDSSAGDWRVLPRLNLLGTYSDNVRLAAGGFGGAQGGDFVTQINPGVVIRGQAPRYNVSVDYTMNNLIYAENSNFNRIRQPVKRDRYW